MTASALLAGWLTVASAAGYEAHLRGHTRVRSSTGTEQLSSGVASDVELRPTLVVRLEEQNLEGRLAYAPRLTLRQALSAPRTELLHTGRLRGEWRPRRGVRLLAEEYATYGVVDLFTQGLGAPGEGEGSGSPPPAPGQVPLEPVPAVSVRFASSLTTLGVETTALSPRLLLSGSVGWVLSGGLDEEARAVLPFQSGPRLRLDARYDVTRLDGLITTATLTDASFSTGARATVALLEETWAHRFSRATEGALGLGVGLTRARASEDAEVRTGALPGAHAWLAHRFDSRDRPLNGRLSARLAPFIDRLTGAIYPRAELTLLMTWEATRGVWVYGQGGAARALGSGPQAGDSLVQGSIGARWLLAPGVNLEGDIRANHVRQQNEQRSERFQWAATLGLSVSHSGIF